MVATIRRSLNQLAGPWHLSWLDVLQPKRLIRGGDGRNDSLRCVSFRVAIRITMTQREFERRREDLETRYQVALEVLAAGHRAQVAELERRWQAEREPEPERIIPKETPRAHRNGAVLDELRAILNQLPDELSKEDILRVLGFSPHRSTLFRALRQLEWEGRLEAVSLRASKATLYRQLRPGSGSEASQ